MSIPSLQLGILKSLLAEAEISAQPLHLNLEFLDFAMAASAQWEEPLRFSPRIYEAIGSRQWTAGLPEWIFRVPPLHFDDPIRVEEYLAFARSKHVGEEDLLRARKLREIAPAFLEHCARLVLDTGAQVVGFTSSYSQNIPSLALATLLKHHNPSLRIVFGGANCESPMGEALHRSFPCIDVVVRGEAEPVLVMLVHDLLSGSEIRPQPGLCIREAEKIRVVEEDPPLVAMHAVPTPDYDEYFDRLQSCGARAEILEQVKLPFQSARGCWWGQRHHCTFCGLNGRTMAFRSKTPDRVLAELRHLARRYQTLRFHVVDDIIDVEYFSGLFPRLHEEGLDLDLFYETKANLTKSQLRLARNSGVRVFQPGIESLSTPILQLMRKGVTGLQNVRLLKWSALLGLQPQWNFLYGFPGEPPAEYEHVAEIVASIVHLPPPSGFNRVRLDRFSPYHREAHAFGLRGVQPFAAYRHLYDVDEGTLEDVAYHFEYQYADGRDPESYVVGARAALDSWRRDYTANRGRLVYRCGPDFLKIHDSRPRIGEHEYLLGQAEAVIFMACDAGNTPAAIRRAFDPEGGLGLDDDEIRRFLDELVAERIVYREGDHYLSLALPAAIDVQERVTPFERRSERPSKAADGHRHDESMVTGGR